MHWVFLNFQFHVFWIKHFTKFSYNWWVSSSLKINLLSFYFLINLLSNRKFPLCTLWCKYLFSWKPIAHLLGPGIVWAADDTYQIKVKKTQHKTSYQNMRLKTCIFPACCSTLIAQWIRKVNYLGDLCRPLYPICHRESCCKQGRAGDKDLWL